MKLIDANAFKAFLEKQRKTRYVFDTLTGRAIGEIILALDAEPAIQADIVKHGRWEKVGQTRVRCTVCNSKKDGGSSPNYFIYYDCCPHCGAIMDMSVED